MPLQPSADAPARGVDAAEPRRRPMKILVAADASWVRNQVRTAFVSPGLEVVEVTRGQDVRGAVLDHEPDLVVLDLQIGNMGGFAVAIDLRLEESGGRLPHMAVLLLLDREADRFLAKRADVDAELVKPFDAGALRRVVKGMFSLGDVRPQKVA